MAVYLTDTFYQWFCCFRVSLILLAILFALSKGKEIKRKYSKKDLNLQENIIKFHFKPIIIHTCNKYLNENNILYMRLFTPHGFSANSTLKLCIKSTLINLSQNPSESFNVPDLQNCVKELGPRTAILGLSICPKMKMVEYVRKSTDSANGSLWFHVCSYEVNFKQVLELCRHK